MKIFHIFFVFCLAIWVYGQQKCKVFEYDESGRYECRFDMEPYFQREIFFVQPLNVKSCAVMSATGLLEKMYEMHYGQKFNLSVQAILDCFGGCDTQPIGKVLSEIQEACKKTEYRTKGIFLQRESKSMPYPRHYTGIEQKCLADQCVELLEEKCFTLKIFSTMGSNALTKFEKLRRNLDRQPVAFVATTGPKFRNYEKPLNNKDFYDPSKDMPKDNAESHGLLVVGYALEKNGKNFILVRNPWYSHKSEGNLWGDKGYAWIKIDDELKEMNLKEQIYMVDIDQ